MLTVYQEALLADILTLLAAEEPRLIRLQLARPILPPPPTPLGGKPR